MKKSALILACASLLFSCNNGNQNLNQTAHSASEKDEHTLSNADLVKISHLDLDVSVDFTSQTIAGSAQWMIDNSSAQKSLFLDTKNLTIDSVKVDGQITPFKLGAEIKFLGSALEIPIEKGSKQVSVFYKTHPDATALKWLTPQQTDAKTNPYLYTQSEALYARTWLPCPDGPGIRYTYNARVKVPHELLALMSATNPQQKNDSGIYHFEMTQPIPAYLMALAVGNIEFRSIDERTGVYAEPTMIEKARHEFEDVGKMVHTAENLYGPYRWGRYDVLVLPYSFPIGGMENPKLTFCTPTIIAGDKSLVNLIAHELAHSWSGNLVTNATWNDIWMNEGFTVYFERRISEAMNGKTYADMLWELGYQDLVTEVNAIGKDSKDTWLKLDLKGRDGDDGLTDIPYEKGSLFLWLIEKKVGREKFDAFLKKYFDKHAFHTITTEQFLTYLNDNLIKGNKDLEQQLNIKAWVYGPNIPNNAPHADRDRFNQVDTVRNQFLKGVSASQLKTTQWSFNEWLHFLRGMPKPLPMAQMKGLDDAFQFTLSGNCEITDLWFTMAIAANYTPAYPAMEVFLSKVGRRKFLEPLYTEMMKNGKAEMANDFYKKYKNNYHPMAQSMVEKVLANKK